MQEKVLKQGDFIVMTDQTDSRYLQIGEVVDVQMDTDGDPKAYFIRFGHDSAIRYGYDLPEQCKVLQFAAR